MSDAPRDALRTWIGLLAGKFEPDDEGESCGTATKRRTAMSDAPEKIIVSTHGFSFSVKAEHDSAFKDVEYVRAKPWVSVKDMLPDDGLIKLVYGPDLTGMFTAGWTGMYWIDDGIDKKVDGVTHWMDLPEPPGEQQ